MTTKELKKGRPNQANYGIGTLSKYVCELEKHIDSLEKALEERDEQAKNFLEKIKAPNYDPKEEYIIITRGELQQKEKEIKKVTKWAKYAKEGYDHLLRDYEKLEQSQAQTNKKLVEKVEKITMKGIFGFSEREAEAFEKGFYSAIRRVKETLTKKEGGSNV